MLIRRNSRLNLKLPSAVCHLLTTDCRLPTADCRLPTADCRLPTADFLLNMTPERWKQIENLYHGALGLTQGQRSAFLNQSCAGDDEVRREVESLLASYEQAHTFIESPPDDVVAGMLAEEQANSI
ncbi:MAG TPA: hypothetical protein VKD91_23255, partial [Pyrinomonadaceae bacterium]|nr:hypothetical protein [Pyrinomonadaceae bacterium]